MTNIVLRKQRIQIIAAVVFLFVAVSPFSPHVARTTAQAVTSFSVRRYYRQWPSAETVYFHLRFSEGERELAGWLGAEADKAVEQVAALLPHDAGETRPWLVIVPDQETMKRAFGWSDGTGALGVYLANTVKVLSPNAWDWYKEENRRDIFTKQGPLVHEYTHFVLDLRADGNYTRWFSEGLSQLTEYRILGYEWLEEGSSLNNTLYSLDELDHSFDTLPRQELAYRQALSLVTYLETLQGMDGINLFLDTLAKDVPFYRALEQVYELDRTDFFTSWQAWQKEDPRWVKTR